MKAKELPSVDYLYSRLDYNPATNEFTWRPLPEDSAFWAGSWNIRYAGKIAGSINAEGYRIICIDGHSYKSHRLAYLMMTGNQPDGLIDHRECSPNDLSLRSDNTPQNIRVATQTQQRYNAGLRRNNTSGYKGVSLLNGRWAAFINDGIKQRYLGSYDTVEAAHLAYRIAAQKVQGDFMHSSVAEMPLPAALPGRYNRPSASGIRYVHKKGKKWVACINRRWLGTFDTVEEAARAVREAKEPSLLEMALIEDQV